jgi:SAM-dependent methyltransferase
MDETLVDPRVAAKWRREHESAIDKRYPSIDLVRLERWYFGARPGRLLEYGFGAGPNLIHMAEAGYTIDAVDISDAAKRRVEKKLADRPGLGDRVRLHILAGNEERLPFADQTFDYVTCLSVLSLLGSRQRALKLLHDFRRTMKPGAKLIIDINAPNSDFARKMEKAPGDVYFFKEKHDTESVPTYCPNEAGFYALIGEVFVIKDRGYSAHKYLDREITEYIACCQKGE